VDRAMEPVTTRRILRTWWPLAASWMLMALELPVVNIIVARLADPEIHLAAYGSVVFPLALLVEAPIIMLLAASTALCSDQSSYRTVRRFTHTVGAALTALHALVAFSPLYGWIARDVLSAPEEVIEPARLGLMIMLPWTWSIAYRRFNQGVLIRFGHSLTVGVGTIVRLTADCALLALGYVLGSLPGTVVATSAIIAGVVSEALYVRWRVRPILHHQMPPSTDRSAPLSTRSFLTFYIPLSLTSLIFLAARPVFTAGISRMVHPLDSLAVYPIITSVTFLFRAGGVAYSETSIALLETPGAYAAVRKFALGLTAVLSLGIVLVAATPIGTIWFGQITGLSGKLLSLARSGLWFAVALPALSTLQSFFQATIVHHKRTRPITEAVVLYLAIVAAALFAGVMWGRFAGAFVALLAMTVGELVRTIWLGWRSRAAREALRARDEA
jgi:hypothetical protein